MKKKIGNDRHRPLFGTNVHLIDHLVESLVSLFWGFYFMLNPPTSKKKVSMLNRISILVQIKSLSFKLYILIQKNLKVIIMKKMPGGLPTVFQFP